VTERGAIRILQCKRKVIESRFFVLPTDSTVFIKWSIKQKCVAKVRSLRATITEEMTMKQVIVFMTNAALERLAN